MYNDRIFIYLERFNSEEKIYFNVSVKILFRFYLLFCNREANSYILQVQNIIYQFSNTTFKIASKQRKNTRILCLWSKVFFLRKRDVDLNWLIFYSVISEYRPVKMYIMHLESRLNLNYQTIIKKAKTKHIFRNKTNLSLLNDGITYNRVIVIKNNCLIL